MKKYLDGVLVDMTTEEIEERNAVIDKHNTLERVLNKLRQKRNRLLTKTDWTANSDVTMSSDMTTYRQALRDATSGLDTVEKVQAYEFPTEVTE